MPKSSRNMFYFFMDIWNNRRHECFVTGHSLELYKSSNLFVNLFAHVLRKSAYPEWKYEEKNIVLVKPEIHALYDDGVMDKIIKYEEKTGHSLEKLFLLEERMHDIYSKSYSSVPRMRKIVYKYREEKHK